jgi:hypothetical protein
MKVQKGVRFSTVPEWLIHADVSAYAVRIWAVLDRASERKDGVVEISTAKVGVLARCSKTTVKKALAELAAIGAVSIERGRTTDAGDPDCNTYTLNLMPHGDRGGSRDDPPVDQATTQGVGREATPYKEKGVQDRKNNNNGVVDISLRRPLAGLIALGFNRDRAQALVETYGEEEVLVQLENLSRQSGVQHKRGWMTAALRDGYELEEAQQVERIPLPPTPEQAEAIARQLFPEKFS